jgi:hypothetical protein
MVISLPFNRKDTVNQRFESYVKSRPDIFGEYIIGEDGLVQDVETIPQNIGIQDVRHPRVLFMSGRVLDSKTNNGRVKDFDFVERDRDSDFQTRGFTKVYLNPDALWLNVYTTAYESHTDRLFTPITKENIEVLSKTPYHPDFPLPPNWSGGQGVEMDHRQAAAEQKHARQRKNMLPVNIIK